MQHDDVVRQRHHRAHDMLGEQDGKAHLARQIRESPHHGVDLGRAQARHHLVEQQDLRPRRQRARRLELLALGQGEAIGDGAGLAGEAEPVEDLQRGLPHGAAVGARLERADHHVLEHGQGAERLHHLEGAADAGMARPVGPQPGDVGAVEDDAAAVGREDAGDEVEGGGLAGSVRADERDDAALGHGEAHAIDRLQATEALGEPAHLEQRGHAHRRTAPMPSRARSHGHSPAGCNATIRSSAAP